MKIFKNLRDQQVQLISVFGLCINKLQVWKEELRKFGFSVFDM